MHIHASSRRQRGFTLIETMIAVGIAGVLSSIAYPSLEGHVLRARRIDALASLMSAQLAQERHRADHATYGDLASIGVRPTTPAGYYVLHVTAVSADGYTLLASAAAAQARDRACRYMKVAATGADAVFASGPDASTGNAADANRRCWGR